MCSLFDLSERKELDGKFKHDQEKQREVLSHLNRVLEEITILEKETCTFLKQCQELYNNEISEVRHDNKLTHVPRHFANLF